LTERQSLSQTWDRKERRRRLIFSKLEFGAPISAHCSVCNHPFEVILGELDNLGTAHERLAAIFDEHVCKEDVNQGAAEAVIPRNTGIN
jgi:hypothetical protein